MSSNSEIVPRMTWMILRGLKKKQEEEKHEN